MNQPPTTRLTLHLGEAPRPVPRVLSMDLPGVPDAALLVSAELPRPLAAQRDRAGKHVVTVPAGIAGEVHVLVEPAVEPAMRAVTEERAVALQSGSRPVTRFCYPEGVARPFCWPLLAPGSLAVTRAYPMATDIPGEQRDHPHHRSLWTAYGEVNGYDNWSEEPGHAFQRVIGTPVTESGPAFARVTAEIEWTTPQGEPEMAETRRLTLYNTDPDVHLLDYDVTLRALVPVHFGDTKEGGIIALRVATTMDGDKGGKLENGVGGVGEKAVWGKPAPWCDYSGPVEGRTAGIGVLEHPTSFRAPCRWHARDYGLLGANVFGAGTFTGDASQSGAMTLPASDAITFRYRLVLHAGDATEGRVADHWWAYSGG
jgi:hypothetical protein